MPRHMLKLLALATVVFVAPASAALILSASPTSNHARCPHHAAKPPAAAAAARPLAKGPTTITLTDRVVDEGSLLDLGRRGFFTP